MFFLWIIQLKICYCRKPWSTIWNWYWYCTILDKPAIENWLNSKANWQGLYHGTYNMRVWTLYQSLISIPNVCYKTYISRVLFMYFLKQIQLSYFGGFNKSIPKNRRIYNTCCISVSVSYVVKREITNEGRYGQRVCSWQNNSPINAWRQW